MLMDRASRFIWEFSCGEQDDSLFMSAIQTLMDLVEKTEDLTLVTDGEKRYGHRCSGFLYVSPSNSNLCIRANDVSLFL